MDGTKIARRKNGRMESYAMESYHLIHDYWCPNQPEVNLLQNITRHTNVRKKI